MITAKRSESVIVADSQRRKVGSPPKEGSMGINVSMIGADYTDEEVEFIVAVHRWMRVNHRRFPSFTDILGVAKSLGYSKAGVTPSGP